MAPVSLSPAQCTCRGSIMLTYPAAGHVGIVPLPVLQDTKMPSSNGASDRKHLDRRKAEFSHVRSLTPVYLDLYCSPYFCRVTITSLSLTVTLF